MVKFLSCLIITTVLITHIYAQVPADQASDIVLSDFSPTEVHISWVRGNGSRCAVFVKKTDNGTPSPANTNYNSNSTFGTSGTQIGTSGWYCVYNGTGSSVNVTGLTAVNTYRVMVCEYNVSGSTYSYKTTSDATNPVNFTIRQNQTITFNAFGSKVYGSEDFYPDAWSTSGLPLSFTFSNPSVASVVDGKIHILGAGSTQITASQNGNSSYYAAADASQTLTVGKADQTIVFESLNDVTYGDPDFFMAASASSGLPVIYSADNPAVVTIVNGKLHINGAGTATITASQAGDDNYNSAVPVSRGIIVNKSAQSIICGDIVPKNYGDPDFNPEASATSGLITEYESSDPAVANITGNLVHITGAGTTLITAKQPGNVNYLPAENCSKTLTVGKATQSVTFNSLAGKTFGDPDFNLNATCTSGLPVVYYSTNTSVAIVSGNTVHITGTGTVNIVANVSGNNNYLAASPVSQQLVVSKADQTITFPALSERTMGDPDFDPGAVSSSGSAVQYISDNPNVAVILDNKIHITGAGTAIIFALQPGNSFYNPAVAVSRTLTVGKGTQIITFPPIPDKYFNDADFSPGAFSSANLPVTYTIDRQDVARVINGRIYITGIGTATVTASQSGNKDYFPATSVTQTLTVLKINQAITFNALPVKVFGDVDFSPDATASSGLKIRYSSSDASVATIVNNKIHITGAGSAIIYADQPGDEYYNPAEQKTQVLTVSKANQTISFDPLPVIKSGGTGFTLEAVSTSGLTVYFRSNNNYVATVTANIVHITGTGDASIIAYQPGNANFNPAPEVTQILHVLKRSQIIIFDTIPAKVYGDPDFKPDATASSGLEVIYTSDNPGVATIKNGNIHIVGTGKAIITATQPGNASYEPAEAPVKKTLVVGKALITAKAENSQKQYNEPNPVFTITYSGFVLNENVSMLNVLPVVLTSASTGSNPGLYDLIPSGGKDDNYDFIYEKGILVIMGKYPLKPEKISGNSILCVNPGLQFYSTGGALFATSYKWNVIPENAGSITENGKSIAIDFRDDYSGKTAIVVKGLNSYGEGDVSDTLFVTILPLPDKSTIRYNGSYCSNSAVYDSIIIVNSQPLYRYQLYREGNPANYILTGNGGEIGWENIEKGHYSIQEKYCDVSTAENIFIREVEPSSVKPAIESKWNDVLVCISGGGDSIRQYQWFRNGEKLESENKQYLWTQKVPGSYTVKTADKNFCEYYSDAVEIVQETAGLIYPNPSSGIFKISFTNPENGQVQVKISAMNSIILKTFLFEKQEESFEKEMNIPDVRPGIYFIDILLNGKRLFYDKLIIN